MTKRPYSTNHQVEWRRLSPSIDHYTFKSTPYIRLKSLLMGWRADSVPCVVYIGPWIVGGGTIL